MQGRGIIGIGDEFPPRRMGDMRDLQGKRYTRETLEVEWKGRTIHDVLEMSVDEACKLFENQSKISRILTTLQDVGLGYIRLGQPATTPLGERHRESSLPLNYTDHQRSTRSTSLMSQRRASRCSTSTN